MPETLDFISLVPWTAVVMVLNLYITYRILRRFLFRPVQNIMKKRQDEVDAVYAEANDAKTQAESAKQSYEAELLSAKEQANQIVTDARDNAIREQKEMQRATTDEARQILIRAEADAKQIQKDAAIEIQNEISDMAIKIAQAVTEKELSEKDHERFIKDFIDQIREGAV